MSHREIACRQKHKGDKGDHIECECSTHLSDSSEHVICKWDTSDQLMRQLSPLTTGQKLEAYSTASLIDTGGTKLTHIPSKVNNSLVSSETARRRADETVQHYSGAAGIVNGRISDELNQLKSDLAETQAVLQKTEEQLLQQMEQNQSQSQAGFQSDYDNSHTGSLQNIIGHLYLNKKDAKKLLTTVKSRLKDIGANITPEKFPLYSQLLDLQAALKDVIAGPDHSEGQTMTSDLQKHAKSSDGTDSQSINIVETLMQKIHCNEAELRRWEVLVQQLQKELDQARLRSESNANALYSKQEECQRREQELHNANLNAENMARLLRTLQSQEQDAGENTHRDQSRMRTDSISHPTAEGTFSELTAQLNQQQLTANKLQLEREHNQRLQELRLGVVEAGNRWEREVMTLDLQLKQSTHQLEEAKKHAEHLEDEKNHQKICLQEMKDSCKRAMLSNDEISGKLASVRGEMANVNQQLAAAKTALTYERNANEKYKEQCNAASQSELQLNEQLRQLQETEHQLSQQLKDSQRASSELRKQCSALCSDLGQANEELQDRADEINRLRAEIEDVVAKSTAEMKAILTKSTAEMESERETSKCVSQELENNLREAEARIEELKEVIARQDKELDELVEAKKAIEVEKSANKQLVEKVSTLKEELQEFQAAVQNQKDENTVLRKQREMAKRDLEVALVRQKSYKELGAMHEEKTEEALKRWEEERKQLTSRMTELQLTLKENKDSLHRAATSNQERVASIEKLQERCEYLQQQTHAKDVSLQTTAERLSNSQRQLLEEKRAKDECERNIKMMRMSLEEKKTTLHSQTSKVSELEKMKTNLKAMAETQKATIETLQKQLKQHHKEHVNYKRQVETSVCLENEENEKVHYELQQNINFLQNEHEQSKQMNSKLSADLAALSGTLDKTRTEHSDVLVSLHKADQREGELKLAQQHLAHQLEMEKDAQKILRKRFEEQEAEIAELRNSLAHLQEDSTPEKTLLVDHLKDSLDHSLRMELNQLKAEIGRQAAIAQSPSLTKKPSEHDKMLILQRELNKLRTMHTADRSNIAMLNEDMTMLRSRLMKQTAIILSSRTHTIHKADIQAALAKAQAKALVMTPQKRQPHLNFDPTNHYYGIPQSAFDDYTLRRFSSEQITSGSTTFSGGSSDCDYSS